jgi:hypothetical protein
MPYKCISERSDSNILKISTPLILVSTTVFKFFVFDHENSQIKIKKITKIKQNAYLPTLPLRESVTGTTPFFLFGLNER